MQNPLSQLVSDLKAKRAEFETALKSVETGEDLARAKALQAECDNLKSRIDVFTQRDEMQDGIKGLDSFLNDPVRGVPFSASGHDGAAADGGHLQVLGSVPAGTSYLETVKGVQQMVWEDGAGIFGESAWKAINTPDYRSAFRDYLRYPRHKISAKAMKTLEEGLDDQGGYLVPVDLINRIVQRKPTPTRVAGLVDSVNTSREFVEMMKLNYATDNIYTTGFRVTKTGEQAASATAARVTDTNLFGTIKIPVHTFMITGLVTLNMIEDAAFNPLNFFESKFSETVDILRDDKIINGIGRQEPKGLIQAMAGTGSGGGLDDPSISYVPTGDASALTADSLIALNCDVPEQYDDNCRYLFNKTSTYKAIKLLKDLNDRYLFGYGVQDSGLRSMGRPTDLDGYPFSWSGLMPNIAANNFPVIFGDFKGYMMVNRIGFSIQVLREVYAELGQVAVVGRVRFGGQVIEPWRLRGLKVATS